VHCGFILKVVKKQWLTILGVLLAGLGAGYFLHGATTVPKILASVPIRAPDSNYPLINSLLGYDNAEAVNFGELTGFKDELTRFTDKQIEEGDADKISVYFRDLTNGQWVGVDYDELYTPASLLKVPIMLAYFHLAETTPGLLSQTLYFDGKSTLDDEQTIKPAETLKAGQSYAIDDLIRYMIVYSDNNAMQLLLKNIDPKEMSKLFTSMNILLPSTENTQDFISPKTYALFFRILYGSTYLGHRQSQKALDLLSKSTFKDGLVAGVPSDTVVAHKFGEYASVEPVSKTVTKRELHDCGIVYPSKGPYLLCVMTEGNDLGKQSTAIREISKMVYEQFIEAK
jgi:beta-lactamase class A